MDERPVKTEAPQPDRWRRDELVTALKARTAPVKVEIDTSPDRGSGWMKR